MLKRLKELFSPKIVYVEKVVEKPVYKVVQVKSIPVQPWSKEIRDAVRTLPSHPGFTAITERLALQRQLLEAKAANEFHKELREADFIQSGIYWLNYVQYLIDKETEVKQRIPRDAMAEELEAFKEIDAAIERVG